ncbi:MAG: archease [Sedimentisphaerales bacterium]|nr:archease [Sedimentisphaerales bacterium]
MTRGRWEHIPHPSDIGIRGVAPTKAEAFAQAAMALTAVIADPEKVEPKQAVDIVCREDDDEMLFMAWLSSLLYEMDARNMLFRRFEIELVEGGLKAKAWGEPVDVAKHEPAVEVKAATYAGLEVGRDNEGNWIAQCIVDV